MSEVNLRGARRVQRESICEGFYAERCLENGIKKLIERLAKIFDT